MATYSPSLKITLLADGEQSGTWGQTQNTNLGTLLEQAITGVVSITMSDANYTLSNLNGASDEARNAVLVVGGTNNDIRKVIAPLEKKLYTVYNGTSGGYAINVGAATGLYVTIPNGVTALVYCDGINFYSGLSGTAGSFSAQGSIAATVNVAAGANVTAVTNVAAGANVTAVTNVAAGVNVTAGSNVVATTAFVGPGTGLTGTASSLTVGAATNATNATNAANLVTTNWTVSESGGVLYFAYGGANVVAITSTGAITSANNVTAYGTI